MCSFFAYTRHLQTYLNPDNTVEATPLFMLRSALDISFSGEPVDGHDTDHMIFPAHGSKWEEVGAKNINGNSNDTRSSLPVPPAVTALIAGSDVVGIAFSRAKRSMLVTAHARGGIGGSCGDGEGKEAGVGGRGERERWRLEGRSVVCVWNAEAVHVSR